MDYYSNYPAPSREEAIKEVMNATGVEEEIVKSVIMGMPSLGSYTGWYVGFKHDAIKEVKRIRERNPKKGAKINSGMKYLLYNINTDHLCEIVYDENIATMYLQLIDAKHKQGIECDDLSFLTQCLLI